MASGTASATIEAMNVLVAYASKRGSTAEIAEAVAETIRSSGASVDCTDVAEVSSIEPYDAVVVGSAVYIKRWRRDARHFLRRHHEQLTQGPFWVFSSGPVGEPKPELDASWTEPRKTIAEAERLGVRAHVVFGGRSRRAAWADRARDGGEHAARVPGHARLGRDPPLGNWDRGRARRPGARLTTDRPGGTERMALLGGAPTVETCPVTTKSRPIPSSGATPSPSEPNASNGCSRRRRRPRMAARHPASEPLGAAAKGASY